MSKKASDLANLVSGELMGEDVTVMRLTEPSAAQKDSVVVLASPKDLAQLTDVGLIVSQKKLELKTPQIIVKDSRLALALLSHAFSHKPYIAEGIHATASIHERASLAKNVHIGANTVIGEGTTIASGTRIAANCVIAEQVEIGENCTVYPNVSVYAHSKLGARVMIHSGTIIGSDGFGYATSQRGAVKIHHLGNVILEDDVEVGANSCIDRATFGATRIGARTKIDNLCQIGHNVTTGTDCIITGTVALAGSTTLGRGVMLGGGVGAVNHAHVGDGAQVGARSLITKDIPAGETWNGYPAEPYKKYVRKHYLLGKLESIWQFVKKAQ